ncbi:CHAT domain-containing protein [Amycolatopsis sp. NPDC051045]|uniref:CHAT domain-containing protein n=1 Tax=Amycolatopsis sp. NPDC051045 TaxID=3156922 RepID=UPI003418FA9F
MPAKSITRRICGLVSLIASKTIPRPAATRGIGHRFGRTPTFRIVFSGAGLPIRAPRCHHGHLRRKDTDLTRWDVFVSYCKADERFAQKLGYELEELGLGVFLRAWDITAGQSEIGRTDEGIAGADSAVIVVGHASHGVTDEYRTLAGQFNARRLRRLVPVLRADGLDVHLPPRLSDQVPLSFADVADDEAFRARVEILADALRDRRARGFVETGFPVPPDTARVEDSPVWTTLRLGPRESVLAVEGKDSVAAAHEGPTQALRNALWTMDSVRRSADRTFRADGPSQDGATAPDLDAACRAVGRRLVEDFLEEPVLTAVRAHLDEVARAGRIVHLALHLDDSLSDLPWESAVLPGDPVPLCLQPSVRLYRQAAGLGPTVRPDVPGPLRVLAVVASPDTGGGQLLDYEYELSRILDEVEAARQDSDAYVRILNWGSLTAIREALTEERFHVLHVSCHARPGELLLETEDGGVDRVRAERFADELAVTGKPVSLVVLAGCSTAQTGRADGLPSVAHALLNRGVPSVLAMTASVSDDYATEMLARTYRELAAQRDGSDPLAAVAIARRELESRRKDDRRRLLAEWATPAYFQRVRGGDLIRPGKHEEPSRPPHRAGLRGIVDLRLGDFVGRRAELRELVRTLRGSGGVLIHGMGGVGKSSLAAQLVHMVRDERTVLVTLHGRCTVDRVLRTVAKRLRHQRGGDQGVLADLEDDEMPWRDRLDDFAECVLPSLRSGILLVLDDPIGDPLESGTPGGSGYGEPEAGLVDFLDAWLGLGKLARLIVTSRHREPLTGSAGHRLRTHHLGPLSAAETRKLVFRLPALDRLPPADRQRVHHDLGGHPRALEYLDAVLRGGRPLEARKGSGTQLDGVMKRIGLALQAEGLDSGSWWRERALDTALAETVAITASDVLLHRLHDELTASFPLAAELFVAASVYRVPVDAAALLWVVTPVRTLDEDPAMRDRLTEAHRALRDGRGLPQDQCEQLIRDLALMAQPPERPGLAAARDRLLELTLLAPIRQPADDGGPPPEQYLVHRWTARELAHHVDPAALVVAHTRAAAYHRSRAQLWVREPAVQIELLEEARHHSWAAGLAAQAVAVTAEMCSVLDRLGRQDWEWSLCEEVIERIGPDSPDARVFHHRMSVIALRRHALPAAESCQRKAMPETAGDSIGTAVGFQQLGTIAQLRSDDSGAEEAYHRAMAIVREASVADRIDARVLLAGCYQRLGGLALGRGDDDGAERFSLGALELAGEIEQEAADTSANLELAAVAAAVGEVEEAQRHGLLALEMAAADLDMCRLVAAASLQLGAVSLTRRLLDDAEEHLELAERLAAEAHDVPLQASCLQLLGEVQVNRLEYENARSTYETFAECADALDDRRSQIVAQQQLGRIHAALGDPAAARETLVSAIALSERLGSDQLAATTRLVLGGVLVGTGELDPATRQFELAHATAERIGDQGLALACALQLALMRLRRGDLTGAQQLFEDGAGRAHALGSTRTGATCLLALGLIARERGAVARAARWYEAALDTASAEHNPRVEAECLARLADLELEKGDNDGAEELYDRCLALLGTVSAPHLRADVLRQVGRCRLYRGEPRRAAEALIRATEAFTELAEPAWVLSCLVCLAWVLPRAGRPQQAGSVKRRAASIDATGLPPQLEVARLLLAGEHAAETGNRTAARVFFRKALHCARETDEPQLLVDCLWHQGRLARENGRIAEARLSVEHALEIAEREDDQMLIVHLLRELGLIVAVQGDRERARRLHLRSAEYAARLGEREAFDCAEALARDGGTGDTSDRVAAAGDDFAELLSLRRVRAVDTGAVFDDRMAAYAGAPIDEIVTGLVPQFSGVSGVPSVVSPSVTSVLRRHPAPGPPAAR